MIQPLMLGGGRYQRVANTRCKHLKRVLNVSQHVANIHNALLMF